MIKLLEQWLGKHLAPGEADAFINENRDVLESAVNGKYGMESAKGWLSVERNASDALLDEIEGLAEKIRREADVFAIVGVGGSNRAAQSVIEGLHKQKTNRLELIYAGDTLSSRSISDMLGGLKGKKAYANIIAKNFSTLEPGIAFRALRECGGDIEFVLTGSLGNGQLGKIAEEREYPFFEFPLEVGGRFSAFTAVGLLPMAVMGVDIRAFVAAASECEHNMKNTALLLNSAVRYAAIRCLLQRKGFFVENLAYFEPRLEKFSKWWLQLHGETEGKNAAAVLPMTTLFSEDLHAIGQYIQQGGRFIFETLLNVIESTGEPIPSGTIDDGFSYLDGKTYDILNQTVFSATAKAHSEGGIPVLELCAPRPSEAMFGEMMYWQMFSSYMSAALMGVEPFDQNGVENYKRNMQKALNQS